MKKLMLSALAVSVMFVSCSKDDVKCDKPEEKPVQNVSTEPKGDYVDIAYIQNKMGNSSAFVAYNAFSANVATTVSPTASADAIRTEFGTWLQNMSVDKNSTASKGVAGKLGKRIVNEKGFEYGQLVKKGLIGAYQFDKALLAGMSAHGAKDKDGREAALKGMAEALIGSYDYIDNKKVKIVSTHGESIGYPVMSGNEFAKYLNVVSSDEDFKTLSDDLYNALREAKKLVDNDPNGEFEKQVLKAFQIAQKVVAIRGTFYLLHGSKDANKLGSNLDHDVAHAISEGLGFVYSLMFTYNPETQQPYYSSQDIYGFFNNLDLWDASAKTKLETKAEEIAQKFGFDINLVKN